ncbi:MAG TPA: hypothetical protein VFG59_05935 [Anaeromyxobacter sp.]|nr:hypothetical protein [Anaeromyxobacter sp.]
MRLTLSRSGETLRAAAGDLARVWRAACLAAGTGVFPALLDGVIEDFLLRFGEAVNAGKAPEEAWSATRGTVRLLPRQEATPILALEWRIARQVLLSGCDAIQAAPETAEQVDRATRAATDAITGLLARRPPAGAQPAGVLIVHQLGGFKPRGAAPHNGGPH